jgi:hypothetical protein
VVTSSSGAGVESGANSLGRLFGSSRTGLIKEYYGKNIRILLLQVNSTKLYDFYKNWRECNGACVQKSVQNFCPPKEVCVKPNFVCNKMCLPASYSQWYQV